MTTEDYLGRDDMIKKGSKDWELFADFYKLCDKYWTPPTGEDESWWDSMWKDTNDFRDKYHDERSRFTEDLVLALRDRLKSLTSNQMRLDV